MFSSQFQEELQRCVREKLFVFSVSVEEKQDPRNTGSASTQLALDRSPAFNQGHCSDFQPGRSQPRPLG